MRTTIEIPERELTLYTELARARRTSLGELLLDLAKRGLESSRDSIREASPPYGETASTYEIDPETGLGVFRSGRPITIDDVDIL